MFNRADRHIDDVSKGLAQFGFDVNTGGGEHHMQPEGFRDFQGFRCGINIADHTAG